MKIVTTAQILATESRVTPALFHPISQKQGGIIDFEVVFTRNDLKQFHKIALSKIEKFFPKIFLEISKMVVIIATTTDNSLR